MSFTNRLSQMITMLFLLMFLCSAALADQINLHIDTQAADDLIQQNVDNAGFYLIDVRTAEEFNAGHLANASYIDFYQKDFINQLEKLDKDKAYLLYCRTGRRSANALEMMKKLGFSEAYNMKGGITQWLKEGRPVVVPK